jgi:imidazole glycerol-phosphate synthase subunit HisH
MIAIVDYGLGNILAFVNLYKRMGVDIVVARTAAELAPATRIVLPGVGAFDHAMDLLDQSGMRDTLDDLVLNRKTPVIGVCVGMQILVGRSDEGTRPGLGWIAGEVKSLRAAQPAVNARLPMPHMGWNDVRPMAGNPVFAGLERDARFYFLHSFFVSCADPGDVGAVCDYGIELTCAVRKGHIHGVQFHPEKSHHFGMRLLKNFAEGLN